MFYDKEGDEINAIEWSSLLNDPNYKIVKQDALKNYFISTVWLGLNHGDKNNLLIFETMVFDKNRKNIYQARYETEEGASTGHEDIVNYYFKINGTKNKA